MDEINELEFFSGGVPPGPLFHGALQDLRELAHQSQDGGISTVRDLCLIGLASYFEAFCKDLFASCINIFPKLIEHLDKRSLDTTIHARRVLEFDDAITRRLGFLLAEKYDFGTAQQINAHFTALLTLTPFGKEDAAAFGHLLADRNLLVHHGGVYTSSYASQRLEKIKLRDQVYYNSLVIDKNTLLSHIQFVEGIAKKMLVGSQRKMKEHVSAAGVQLDEAGTKAVDYLQWYD